MLFSFYRRLPPLQLLCAPFAKLTVIAIFTAHIQSPSKEGQIVRGLLAGSRCQETPGRTAISSRAGQEKSQHIIVTCSHRQFEKSLSPCITQRDRANKAHISKIKVKDILQSCSWGRDLPSHRGCFCCTFRLLSLALQSTEK